MGVVGIVVVDDGGVGGGMVLVVGFEMVIVGVVLDLAVVGLGLDSMVWVGAIAKMGVWDIGNQMRCVWIVVVVLLGVIGVSANLYAWVCG